MSFKMIHISDLHIGETDARSNNFKKISKSIIEHHSRESEKPIILVTGDIVDDGQPDQYADASALLTDLRHEGFTIFAVPGNHDYGTGGCHALESKFKYFKSVFYPSENVTYPQVKEIDGHYLIGLNSMKAELGFWEGLLPNGELGIKQIEDMIMFLERFSKRDSTKKVIVLLHHHPFIFPDDELHTLDLKAIKDFIYESKIHQLNDGNVLMKKISGRNGKPLVDILLFGHDHCHLDFSNTSIARNYGIQIILSSGKSTESSTEYKPDDDGRSTSTELNSGLLGRLIDIDNAGKITYSTIKF